MYSGHMSDPEGGGRFCFNLFSSSDHAFSGTTHQHARIELVTKNRGEFAQVPAVLSRDK